MPVVILQKDNVLYPMVLPAKNILYYSICSVHNKVCFVDSTIGISLKYSQ